MVRFGIQPGPALHEEGQGENKQVRPGEPSRREAGRVRREVPEIGTSTKSMGGLEPALLLYFVALGVAAVVVLRAAASGAGSAAAAAVCRVTVMPPCCGTRSARAWMAKRCCTTDIVLAS